MKKLQKRKISDHDANNEENVHNVESNMTFNLVEEHPPHKYMVMSKTYCYSTHKQFKPYPRYN